MPTQEGHAWMQRSSPARTLTSSPRIARKTRASPTTCSHARSSVTTIPPRNKQLRWRSAGGRGAVRKTVFTCPGDDNSYHRRDGAVLTNEGAHGVRNRLRGGMSLVVLGIVGGVARGSEQRRRERCALPGRGWLRSDSGCGWSRRDARIIQTWGLRQQVPDENPGVHGTPSPTHQGCRSR